jgi:hypothetical protein
MSHCKNCYQGICLLEEIEILPVFQAKGYCKEFRFSNPESNTMEERYNQILDEKYGGNKNV